MKSIYFSTVALIFISAYLSSCTKEKEPGNQDVSFTIGISQNGLALKSALTCNLSNAKKIVLTIQNNDGTATTYTSTEVKIYQMYGAFISQKLILKVGYYRITEFLLLDSTGNTIFAAPMAGSQEAQNVTHPLTIAFNVSKDTNSPITVEVLCTENKSPGNFGLVSFPIIKVPVFNFLITVADKQSKNLLSAKLTISNGLYTYVQTLDSIANNNVTVKDSLNSNIYTLTLEKDGYVTYKKAFTRDSLRLFNGKGNHLPLLVELERNNNNFGTVTDVDGNVYKTVKIGDQWWMAENLKVTHYRNGDPITKGILYPVGDRNNINYSEKYYDYNNDSSNSVIYGRLYGFSVIRDTRNITPTGWRVATDEDWYKLATFVKYDAGMLKENGTAHWQNPNTATNVTGFTALPSGCLSFWLFLGRGTQAVWWAPQTSKPTNTWGWWMYDNSMSSTDIQGSNLAVRCVKE